MNSHRYGIVAPGVRDNDWAHAAYDDVWYAADVLRRRSGIAIAVAVDADAAPGEPRASEAGEQSTGSE